MKFIELTNIFGEAVSINLLYITSILKNKDFCRIYIRNDGYIDVTNSYEYIMTTIDEIGERG